MHLISPQDYSVNNYCGLFAPGVFGVQLHTTTSYGRTIFGWCVFASSFGLLLGWCWKITTDQRNFSPCLPTMPVYLSQMRYHHGSIDASCRTYGAYTYNSLPKWTNLLFFSTILTTSHLPQKTYYLEEWIEEGRRAPQWHGIEYMKKRRARRLHFGTPLYQDISPGLHTLHLQHHCSWVWHGYLGT